MALMSLPIGYSLSRIPHRKWSNYCGEWKYSKEYAVIHSYVIIHKLTSRISLQKMLQYLIVQSKIPVIFGWKFCLVQNLCQNLVFKTLFVIKDTRYRTEFKLYDSELAFTDGDGF